MKSELPEVMANCGLNVLLVPGKAEIDEGQEEGWRDLAPRGSIGRSDRFE